ncbi:MAG TPA: hypothetical protein VIV60_01715, partial [Polyangiaceae bacterium]
MSTPNLPPDFMPDLEWDDPQRPSGAEWQGILSLSLEFEGPDNARTATLNVFPMQSSVGPDDYVLRVSGPQTLRFDVTPASEGTPYRLTFSELGGRGTYYVTLLQNRDTAGFPVHPFFATASFNFMIDCETGDCRQSTMTAPAVSVQTAPSVDLVTKDFDGFLQLLADRVRVQNQDWTDLSPASLERVLLELLAHHGDMLSYYQDRVANEAFLDTASQRYSIRQHGLLLGYQLFEGQAATTTLSFSVSAPITVPAHFAVRAPRRVDEAPVIFSVISDTRLDDSRNPGSLRPAQWPGALTARVPQGSTWMMLLTHVTALELGMRIALVQSGISTQIRTITALEPLDRAGWVENPNTVGGLSTNVVPVTRIHWDEPLAFDLAVWDQSTAVDGGDHVPLKIHANLVDARHGQWKKARLMDVPTERDDSEPDIPLTSQSAVISRVAEDQWQLRALRLLEGPVLFDLVGETLVPAVEVRRGQSELWFKQPYLERSQPFDRHFVAMSDNDGRLWLQFGDGRRGQPIILDVDDQEPNVETARLTHGNALHFTYRVGSPLTGNIDIGKLTEIVPGQIISGLDQSTISYVTNVTPGTGGKLPETLDAARLAIPASLRHGVLQRAVTLDDYARLAELTSPRVARATARSVGGPFGTVLVLIDPKDEAVLDDTLKASIER